MVLDNHSRNNPRSPKNSSQASSRRESLRSSHTEKDLGPTTPVGRLTRKRAASLDTDAANSLDLDELSLFSSTSNNSESREPVCLCQPDPKIPRPRNAFILYRQHYQGQVVAQNPGLANPEISKIIGAQWRDQPIEVKNEWKRLAEEEKHRHQRQYPDYRYQPRRSAKINGLRVVSLEEPGRCPKCNGRYISTPGTPITPFSTASMLSRPAHQPQFNAIPEGMENERSLMPSSNASRMPQHPGMHRRPQFLQMDNFRRDDDVEMIQSPRIKRHRQNDGNPYLSPLSSWPGNAQRLGRPPISAVGYDEHRGPMPGPRNVMYQLQSHGIMNPPPRPSPLQDQNPHYQGGKGQNFDESLRLPPLQTQLHHAKSNSRPENQRLMGSDSQKRSIEAMVMTIPFINKIKVLNKISPPLAANGPTSPGQETRGVVIAVEGVDLKLVGEVGRYIEDCLSKEPECFVKTWTGSTPSFPSSTRSSMAVASESSDAEMGNTTPNTKEPKGKAKDAPNSKASQDQEPKYPLDPFTAYLSEIQSWHAKSTEIISFITHHPATSSHSQCRSHSNAQTLDPTSTSDLKRHSPSCSPTSTPPPAASDSKGSANARKRIPIALMPTGFSLTFSDRSAATIPINDAYAPVDHWQWMATLWRGIVGPDLTVYVTGAAMLDDDGGGGGGGNGGIGTKDGGSVECRLDCRAMVVRAAAREDIGEKVLRRVGFEVSEFVRGVGFGGAD